MKNVNIIVKLYMSSSHKIIMLVTLLAAISVLAAAEEVKRDTPAGQQPVQLLSYRSGTMRMYEQGLRRYLRGDLEIAEELTLKTLRHEPDSIEAKWLLANIYYQKKNLAGCLMSLETLGCEKQLNQNCGSKLFTMVQEVMSYPVIRSLLLLI